MQRAPWSLVMILLATLVLVGVAAEEHDPGTVSVTHHAVAP